MAEFLEGEEAASAAGLVYVSDDEPGIGRRRAGRGVYYLYPDGKKVVGAATLRRIEQLKIPPAWCNVWICRRERGHLQAVGEDEKGRKQYIYHPLWRQVRDDTKFSRLAPFGRALPYIRQQVQRDLRKKGLPKEKVVAAIVALLEKTRIRVGNEQYARENNSYGLTTFKGKHVSVRGKRLQFRFRGKSGLQHEIDLEDGQLADVVRSLQELPGQELFRYEDEVGGLGWVTSTDVNAYLHLVSGENFTAKDFRTWQASLLTAQGLRERGRSQSEREAKKTVSEVLQEVACALGNTPAVCRQAYVHPRLLETYLNDLHLEVLDGFPKRKLTACGPLKPDEARLVCFVEDY